MKTLKTIFINATKSTASTIFRLSKIVVPVIFALTLIKTLGILTYIADLFNPFMQIFNLPGEASLPLILGFVVNLYAAIGAIETLELTSSQITTIAIILLIAHSLLLETAVITTIGVKKKTQLFLRLGTAITVGIIVGNVIGVLIWIV